MTIVSVLNYSLRWLYKSIAIFLVVFAVLLSCLRLFLPYAHHYREDVQDYINKTYQTNIVIEQINTGWASSGPSLVGKNISLLNANGVEIFVGNLEIELDFWKTLEHQQFITTNLNLSDTKVFIDPKLLKGNEAQKEEREILSQLSNLFLTQFPRFTIQNSQLQIQLANATRTLFLSELAWLNDGNRHQAKGEVVVDGLSTNKLKLLVDLEGANEDNLNGQAYFEANSINITPWLAQYLAIDDSKTDSSINFQTWLDIQKGSAKQLLFKFADNHITWQQEEEEQKLTVLDGYAVVKTNQSGKDYHFFSSPILWQVNDHAIQAVELDVLLDDNRLTGHVSEVDIASLLNLTPLLLDDVDLQNTLLSLSPQGTVSDVFFQYDEQFALTTNIHDVSSNHYQGIPGIENLSAQLFYYEQQLSIALDANNGVLDFGEHFKRAIPYQSLSANVNLSFDNGILAEVSDIELLSEELTLSGTTEVRIPVDAPASMALLVDIKDVQANNARHYYPYHLMGDDLVNFLNRALTDGYVPTAKVIFDGQFKDFPFTDAPGKFQVDAELVDSTFVFDSRWPAIDNLNANLNFTNNSMLITAHSGKLSGLDVKGVTAGIEDLSYEQILIVDAELNQQLPEHLASLMANSSLKKSVGRVLKQAVFSKPISGSFSLNLPLNNIDASVAIGEIQFIDNDLHLQSPNMQFSHLNGVLKFNNEKIITNDLVLNWRDKPLALMVNAQDESDYYHTNIKIQADWAKSSWQQEVPESLNKYIDSDLTWQGDLSLFIPRNADFSYQLSLSSDLTKNALNLPQPYLKPASQVSLLTAIVKGGEHQSTIQANLDDDLSFYGDLNHHKAFLTRAHLVLGHEKMMLPLDGFHISAMLEEIDVAEWQPFIADILTSVEHNSEKISHAIIGQPERIRGAVRNVILDDLTFNNVTFNMLDQENWWLLELNAKEARSQVKIYPDWHQQGLAINLDFLNLNQEESTEESQSVTDIQTVDKLINHQQNQRFFSSIPPIKVTCDSCRIGKFDFGKVSFGIAKENEQLLLLNNFVAKRKGFETKLSGQWLMQDDYSSTQLEGNIAVKNLESEMDKMGYASIIKDSGAEVTFDINWLGGLQDFSTRTFNGKIKSELDDGYLADVPDQAKIFSILSLQSVVRKLTLDFRDIFSDGMFYSKITGDATIEKGVIYTDNIKMKGSAGDLLVKGNTNLISGALDYRMSYKPNLTSSLPVLGWIATLNPVAIIAGVAIDEVITSKVVSEFNFELTGSIEEPNLKEVNRKNKNISVGRSTPPKIIDKVEQEPTEQIQVEPLKQYKPIYENKDG